MVAPNHKGIGDSRDLRPNPNQKPEILTWVKSKVSRFLLMLDMVGEPFSEYDHNQNTIVVTICWNYKIPKQCPRQNYLVLFEENCENAGNKPIIGFQVKDVRGLCLKYHILAVNNKLQISKILNGLLTEILTDCQTVALRMALEFVKKHKLDEVEFSLA